MDPCSLSLSLSPLAGTGGKNCTVVAVAATIFDTSTAYAQQQMVPLLNVCALRWASFLNIFFKRFILGKSWLSSEMKFRCHYSFFFPFLLPVDCFMIINSNVINFNSIHTVGQDSLDRCLSDHWPVQKWVVSVPIPTLNEGNHNKGRESLPRPKMRQTTSIEQVEAMAFSFPSLEQDKVP